MNEPSGIPIYTSLRKLGSCNKPDVLLDLQIQMLFSKMYMNAIITWNSSCVGTSGLSQG